MTSSYDRELRPENRWAIVVICFVVAACFLAPSKSFSNALIYLLAFISSVSVILKKKCLTEIWRWEKELIVFFVLTCLSCFWGSKESLSYALKSSWAIMFLVFFMLRFKDEIDKYFDIVMTALIFAAAVWATVLIIFHISNVGIDLSFTKMKVSYGPVIQTIRAASILAVALLVAIWSIFWKTGYLRIVGMLSALPLLYSILLLHSRGAVLALCVGLTIIYLLSNASENRFKKYLIGFCLFASLLILGSVFSLAFNPKGINDTVRIPIWAEAIGEIYPEKLLFGKGYSKDQSITVPGVLTYDHAHNIFVSIIRLTGVLGLSLWILHIIKVVTRGFLSSPFSPAFQLSVGWFAFGLTTTFFNGRYPVYVSPDIILTLWLPLAILSLPHETPSADGQVVNRRLSIF